MILKNFKDYIDASDAFNSENFNISGSFNREYYSYSFISSWLCCPARTMLDRIMNEEKSPPLLIGSAVHSILENKCKNNLSDEETLQMCSTDKFDLDPFYICKVKEYVKSYLTIKPYIEGMKIDKSIAEHQIISEVKPLNGSILPMKIKGIIDRIDLSPSGLFIIDYKTCSWNSIPESKYIKQMVMYKWLVEYSYGASVDDVYIAGIFKDHSEYIKQNITFEIQSRTVDDLFNVDQEVAESIDNDYLYKKKEGDYCKYCPLKDKCKDEVNIKITS